MPEIKVLRERCVACGDCVELCPQSGKGCPAPVLVLAEAGEAKVVGPAGCIGCYTCVEYCRAAAIVITEGAHQTDAQPAIYPTRPVSRII